MAKKRGPRQATPVKIQPRGPVAFAAFFFAALVAYWPALQGTLLWDDERHVTRPGLQSLHGLWRIWFDLGAMQQYYPLLHSPGFAPAQELLSRLRSEPR